MPLATNDSYSAASGGSIYAGFEPPALPSWMSAAVGEWAQISGTTAPNKLKDYCGLAWIVTGSSVKAISAASGGHSGNTTDNAVEAIELDTTSPAWTVLRTGDSSSGWDTTGSTSPYFPNGKPAPRHTYTDCVYVPEHNRVVVAGRFWGSDAADWEVVDGFNLSTNDWDSSGTYASRPSAGCVFGARDPSTGIWYAPRAISNGNTYKWTPGANPAAAAFSSWSVSGSVTPGVVGHAWDTTRNNIFHLSCGNGFSNGGAINACQVNPSTGVKTTITFNSSAGYTDFDTNKADIFTNALVYDPDADKFYLYNGGPEGTQKVYVITPNGTTTWDMALMSVTGVTPSVSLSLSVGGVNTKFFYVSRWRCLLLVVPNQNVYYLRTA